MNELKGYVGVIDLTADIVSAYVANNKLDATQVAALITSTYAALNTVGTPEAEPEPNDQLKTKAEIKKSIGGSHLISFLDGKPYRSLKRHLTANGHSIAEYKARFGLPDDYPMTAPEYSAQRSALAKQLGLGAGGRKPKAEGKPTAKARAKPKK
jgi:predicted transcriptional regulator